MPHQKTLFGLGFRPKHYQDLMLSRRKHVDLLELMTENYLHHATAKRSFLDRLAEDWPLALHGVSLSIGGTDPLNMAYLHQLKRLIQRLRPGFVSDHLCWTTFRGHNSHDLLPLSYTIQTLNHVATRVEQAQDVLGCQLFFENPSAYVSFQASTLDEGQFLAELCKKTGCGVLLDVNNLYVSQKNLGLDPTKYMSYLRPEWIAYLHIAGHTNQGTLLVDTHDHPVADDVWDLYEKVAASLPDTPTILEWDGDVPPLSTLLGELDQARLRHKKALLSGPHRWPQPSAEPPPQDGIPPTHEPWPELQHGFFELITHRSNQPSAAKHCSLLLDMTLPAPANIGLKVYRDAYWARLLKVLRGTYPSLTKVLGTRPFSEICSDYLEAFPPSEPDIKFAGQHMSLFFHTRFRSENILVPQDLLADIAALEWAKYDAADDLEEDEGVPLDLLSKLSPEAWPIALFEFTPKLRVIKSRWKIGPVLDATAKDEVAAHPELENSAYFVSKKQGTVEVAMPLWEESLLFELLRLRKTFAEALEKTKNEELTAHDIAQGVTWLSQWCSDGLVTRISAGGREITL